MKEKAIEVLVLSEVRWSGNAVSHLEDIVITYCGIADSEQHCHSRGVTVLLSLEVSWFSV